MLCKKVVVKFKLFESTYILEDLCNRLCNYVRPFLKIPLLDFDQTFRDGGDPP